MMEFLLTLIEITTTFLENLQYRREDRKEEKYDRPLAERVWAISPLPSYEVFSDRP